jgi:FKBP-type peptidyl-prolyl cis-trans isomerase FkpA
MRRSIYMVFLIIIGIATGCQKDSITRFEDERREIRKYLEANNLQFIEQSTGLFMVTDVEGTNGSPGQGALVEVKYKGYYLDGEIFDETIGNQTAKFNLYSLVLGWRYGVPFMKKGGKSRLIMPSRLGYGSNPPPGIRPNAILVFEVELIDFVD